MKKILLGRGSKKTEVTIMNAEELTEFLKDKTVYHHSVGWIEKWENTDILRYFPFQGFTLPAEITLKGYQKYLDEKWPDNRKYDRGGYSDKCLSTETADGISMYALPRYKVSIKKNKNSATYYVTTLK